MGLQPGRDLRVVRRCGGLDHFVRETSQVAEQDHQARPVRDGPRPAGQRAGRTRSGGLRAGQHPRGQRRPERRDHGDLVRALGARAGQHEQHDVSGDGHGQDLVHQGGAGEEPPRRHEQSQADQGQAHHVEQRGVVRPAGQPAVIGAEDLRHGPQRVQVSRDVVQREPERNRVQDVTAEGPEHPLYHPGEPHRNARRRDQGQLVPARGDAAGQAPLPDRRLGDPEGADQGQRYHPDQEHQLVGDEDPRQSQRGQHRHVPAPAEPGRGAARSAGRGPRSRCGRRSGEGRRHRCRAAARA